MMRKRMQIVDSSESWAITSSLMKPVFHELCIEEIGRGGIRPIGATNSLYREAATVYFEMPDFLLASRERMHLDFPLRQVRRALNRLLKDLRSSEARANVATLAGVFASYRADDVAALEIRSGLPESAANQIMALFEDELYKEMSAGGWLMGLLARVDHAFVVFSRCARQIASSSLFKPIVGLTSKMINAATHIPTPDSEIGSLIAARGFMPPIVQLANSRRDAPYFALAKSAAAPAASPNAFLATARFLYAFV